MKKIISLIIAVALIFACALSANAATGITADEQKIIDALSKKITMASGSVAELPAVYINQAEDYLIKAELEKEDCDKIVAYIEAAAKIIADSKAENYSALSKAERQAVLAEARKAAAVINAQLIVKKGEKAGDWEITLKFTAESEVPGYTAEDTPIKISINGNDIIKQTGAEGNMISVVVAASVVMMGLAFVVVASRKKVTDR